MGSLCPKVLGNGQNRFVRLKMIRSDGLGVRNSALTLVSGWWWGPRRPRPQSVFEELILVGVGVPG
jgi:hypothetical protein